MSIPLDSCGEVPVGGHCVSFHATQEEAADQAASFVAGAAPSQAASYWVPQPGLLPLYRDRMASMDARRVRSIRVLAGPQVHRVGQRLRPVEEVAAFVERHPEGVTGGAETISWYWTADDIKDHLEYEQWFQLQPRAHSRFLCPYDLRRIPADDALPILRELVGHHSHLVLSRGRDESIRLLQLLLFSDAREIPPWLASDLAWGLRSGYVTVGEHTGHLSMTTEGHQLLDAWRRD